MWVTREPYILSASSQNILATYVENVLTICLPHVNSKSNAIRVFEDSECVISSVHLIILKMTVSKSKASFP